MLFTACDNPTPPLPPSVSETGSERQMNDILQQHNIIFLHNITFSYFLLPLNAIPMIYNIFQYDIHHLIKDCKKIFFYQK